MAYALSSFLLFLAAIMQHHHLAWLEKEKKCLFFVPRLVIFHKLWKILCLSPFLGYEHLSISIQKNRKNARRRMQYIYLYIFMTKVGKYIFTSVNLKKILNNLRTGDNFFFRSVRSCVGWCKIKKWFFWSLCLFTIVEAKYYLLNSWDALLAIVSKCLCWKTKTSAGVEFSCFALLHSTFLRSRMQRSSYHFRKKRNICLEGMHDVVHLARTLDEKGESSKKKPTHIHDY